MRGCMIWIGLATLVVVFVVGFRCLPLIHAARSRRLSERLGITPVPLESMIDQLGKTAGNEYLRYLERPNEAASAERRPGAAIWRVADCRRQRKKNLHYWYRLMQSAFSGVDYRRANPSGARVSARAGPGCERFA